MEYAVITLGSIGLPATDDHLKVKESQVFLHIRLKEWPYKEKKFLLGGIIFIPEIE